MNLKLATLAIACASTLTALAGCGNRGGQMVSLSIAGAATPAGGSASAGALTLTSGNDTLVITRAAIVLRKVELEHESASRDAPAHDDDCEELEQGPLLAELPLGGDASTVITVPVATGTYDEVEFKIHKVGDDPADLRFLAAHPEMDHRSIRVEGTFNGQAFLYVSSLEGEQEIRLDPRSS